MNFKDLLMFALGFTAGFNVAMLLCIRAYLKRAAKLRKETCADLCHCWVFDHRYMPYYPVRPKITSDVTGAETETKQEEKTIC